MLVLARGAAGLESRTLLLAVGTGKSLGAGDLIGTGSNLSKAHPVNSRPTYIAIIIIIIIIIVFLPFELPLRLSRIFAAHAADVARIAGHAGPGYARQIVTNAIGAAPLSKLLRIRFPVLAGRHRKVFGQEAKRKLGSLSLFR